MKKLILVLVIGAIFSCKDNKSNEKYRADSLSNANDQKSSSSVNNTAIPNSSNLNSSTTTPNDSLSTRRDSVNNR